MLLWKPGILQCFMLCLAQLSTPTRELGPNPGPQLQAREQLTSPQVSHRSMEASCRLRCPGVAQQACTISAKLLRMLQLALVFLVTMRLIAMLRSELRLQLALVLAPIRHLDLQLHRRLHQHRHHQTPGRCKCRTTSPPC